MIVALLVLTLVPGPATAGAPVRGPALAAAPTAHGVESLNTLSDSGAYFSDPSTPSASPVVQDSLMPLSTGTTTRVSVASDGGQGNGSSFSSSISADERYVAFQSQASNLVGGDTNGAYDVFVHDRQTAQTTRASLASDGGQGNDDSGGTSISADGRYVAFYSNASNLVPDDTNGTYDVFVHDQQTGETTRISVASNGGQGNSSSYWPSISDDGCSVVFNSWASNLVDGDTNNFCDADYDGQYDDNCLDVFVHDRQTGKTTRVSVASNGSQSNDTSYQPSISADGCYVAFESSASNLVSGDTNGTTDVFVHNRQTGETTLVSISSDGGQGNGGSYLPSISADGRYVAFYSVTSNLVGGDTNGWADIFVHDRQTGETTRVSVASDGTQGNEGSYSPFISASGRYVAFGSGASNLIGSDTNNKIDIFVHDRGGPEPPTAVTIAGPTAGFTQTGYIFIATASPVTTTLPITYTWEATGQSPVTSTSGLNDTVTFTWSVIGTQTITVTAMNVVRAVTGTHVITISPVHKLFLPLVLRNP